MLRHNPPQHQVAVRDRERAAAAIARGAGICAGTIGANDQLHAVERQTEPPPAATVSIASIGVMIRTPAFSVSNSYSKRPSYRDTSVLVPPMSNPIARRKPAASAAREKPTTPPAGPEKMQSLPVKQAARRQPPRRGHQADVAAGQRSGQPLDIRPQNRIQVSIDDRRIPSWHDFHQWRYAAGDADFGELHLPSDLLDQLFVSRIDITVEKADRERFDSRRFERGKLSGDLLLAGREKNAAVGRHPLIDLGDGHKQRLRLLDGQLKEFGPVLIADAQYIREACVVTKAVFAPRCVSNALVPRVVPSRTLQEGIG